MAAAFFNVLTDPAKARAISAGTEPADGVHPKVVDAMREVGIDLSAAHPRRLTPELASQASLLITMGSGEACPFVPGVEREDWESSRTSASRRATRRAGSAWRPCAASHLNPERTGPASSAACAARIFSTSRL